MTKQSRADKAAKLKERRLRSALKKCRAIVRSWQHGAIGYDKHGRAAMRNAVKAADKALGDE